MRVKQGHSTLADELAAVAELRAQVHTPDASLVLFFCSTRYDLDRLGPAMAAAFAGPVVGCTSAGQIGASGYVDGGISAVSLASAELCATPYLLSSLSDSVQAAEVGYRVAVDLARSSSRKAVGLLLVDGSSKSEERIVAALFEALADVPIVGGSAAGGPNGGGVSVYYDGSFRRDVGVFVLLETTLPFVTFKVQHAVPGTRKLVITEADADSRLVREINGKPAAAEYARQIGVDPRLLRPLTCTEHPLLWSIGGEHFPRAIRSVNADGSLSFSCAVDAGLVLTIGEPAPALTALRDGFASATARLPSVSVVLGFDCFLRRLEFEARGEAGVIGEFLATQKVVGFCCDGQQFDSLHLNQTFAALALGAG